MTLSRAFAFLLLSASSPALEWQPIPGGRFAEVSINSTGKPGFSAVSPASTHVAFTNFVAEERHLTNQIYLNGSGVAAGDVDGDGWCDLYFCSLRQGNKLFRNLGNWQFQDITESAGVKCAFLDTTAAAFADVDGDGDLDLLLNSIGGGTHVYINDGKGHFEDSQAFNAGRAGMSMALADTDGDGALDIYIANYRTVTLRDQPNTHFSIRMVNGEPIVDRVDGRPLTSPDLTNRFEFRFRTVGESTKFTPDEFGEADLFCRNNGGGRFTPVPFTSGNFLDEEERPLSKPPFDWGLSVLFRDLNGDGLPDLYVCNDFRSPDRIWINQGKGKFRALFRLALRQTPLSSMAVDVADINRDGFDDIFVVDMLSSDHVRRHSQRIDIKPETQIPGLIDNRPQYGRNMLFLNRGDGTYAEIAQLAGLQASEWSWTSIFLDVDLDGYEDLLVANGFERDGMNVDVLKQLEIMKRNQKLSNLEQLRLRRLFPRLPTANMAFRNLGNLQFKQMSSEWGFDLKSVSQGMALADLDNDGDLDVVINNMNEPAALLRNNAPGQRLGVRLKGKGTNTRGIGAKIKLTGGPAVQSQEMICGGRYLSSDDFIRTFAAGDVAMRIEVRWPSGKQTTVTNAKANRIYEIDEGAAVEPALPAKPQTFALFQDASDRIGHSHVDEAFDDFALQPMLPKRLSQLGPGVSWFDCDNDGWDDLIIASGRGGRLAVFRSNQQGGFSRLAGAPYDQAVTRDQTTILGLRTAPGNSVLLAGSANYEDGFNAGSIVRQYDLSRQVVSDPLPGSDSSTGPLALADIDGDGQLELFAGGRVISAKYPEQASSILLRSKNGSYAADDAITPLFARIGLVSGSVFSDLNGDGYPELILACEWGPVRVFRNNRGRLTDATVELKLSQYTGWWNGVTTGDFDGDGRMDIVAANWGSNSRFQSFRNPSLSVYGGDIDGNGISEYIEAYNDPLSRKLLPFQPLYVVAAAIPFLNEKFPTADSYARATIDQIYGDKLTAAARFEATYLESMIFLNRGDHFEARALPIEAQMAPAFAICVADFDGDRIEDLFLSQNFFATAPETSRYDAGRGLCLLGDGTGGFRPLSGQESGITVYGEQRGAATCDYDHDGRVDLAVAQNSAATRLFRNQTSRPCLRVRLRGPAGNPTGIGAIMRTQSGERWGPGREVHAGSGYWSQDSAVQLFGGEKLNAIEVLWPGGSKKISLIPEGAKEIEVELSGAVRKVR